jgi:hypothetical protein
MNMSARDAYKLIDEMALGQQQWSLVRGPVRGELGVIEMDISTKLAAEMEAMQKSIDHLTNQNISAVHQSPTCAICGGGGHLAINCNWGRSAEGVRRKSMHSTIILNHRTTLTQTPTILDEEITQISTRTINLKTRTNIPIKIDQFRDTGRDNLTKVLHRSLIWSK